MPFVILILGFAVIPFAINQKFDDPEITQSAIYFSVLAILVFGVPTLLLHFYYLITNSRTQVVSEKGRIYLSFNKQEHIFDVTEIVKIELKLTVSAYFGGIPFIPSENHLIGRIFLDGNKAFVITSLLDEDLNWLRQLKAKIIRVKVRPLCF
jgi:hypothetical protein